MLKAIRITTTTSEHTLHYTRCLNGKDQAHKSFRQSFWEAKVDGGKKCLDSLNVSEVYLLLYLPFIEGVDTLQSVTFQKSLNKILVFCAFFKFFLKLV